MIAMGMMGKSIGLATTCGTLVVAATGDGAAGGDAMGDVVVMGEAVGLATLTVGPGAAEGVQAESRRSPVVLVSALRKARRFWRGEATDKPRDDGCAKR